MKEFLEKWLDRVNKLAALKARDPKTYMWLVEQCIGFGVVMGILFTWFVFAAAYYL